MTEPSPQSTPQRHPSTAALATLLAFTLLGAVALGWLWYTRYAPLHFDTGQAPTITDARDATWILPTIFAGAFLLALAWLLTWRRMRWEITALPLGIGIIGVLALVFAGREYWEIANTYQPVLVASYLCDADSPGIEAGSNLIPEGCEPVPSSALITVGTFDDPAMYTPDTLSDGPARFSDLPRGRYSATLTTTIPPDTASARLVVETSVGLRDASRLERVDGDTWSGRITLHPNLERYSILMYSSPYAEAPDAEIAFTVFSCPDASLADFDASACQPLRIDAPVMEEMPLSEADAAPGRPPTASVEDGVMTLSNLEARTYTLVPTAGLASLTGDIPAILVIPGSEPQTRDNSVLQPGGSPFGTISVEIGERTGAVDYFIYVFDDGQTVAQATGPLAGMRP